MKTFRCTIPFLLVLAAPLLNAQIGLPQEEADKYHTNLLVSRIRQQTARIVPRKTIGLPRELSIRIQYPGQNENPDFSIKLNRTPLLVVLPHNFSSWAFKKEYIIPFVHTYLSARTGSRLPVNSIWITGAILHDIYEPGALYGTAGYGNTPYARALLAHGIAPDLKTILNTSFSDFYGLSSSSARMEWCALLLKKVSVKENLAELLIRQSMRSSNADAFEKTVFPALNPPKKNAAGSTGTISMQDWFLQICMDDVLGRGIPAACPWIEMQFTEIMAQIHPILKAPKKNPDNTPGNFSEEEIAAMTRAEQKLNQLGLKSTEQIALKLFRCARSIRNFKLSPHNLESLPALKQDEQAVYTALSERVALEARLRSAEKTLLPPGSRWALTMKAIARKNADLPLLSRANSLLDHFEKEF